MIKNYQKFLESNQDIDAICKQYGITNYTINQDGTVDVDGDVNISSWSSWLRLRKERLTKLPLKFGRVTGWFDCSGNQLTSLEGCPNWVGGGFNCADNQLTTLEGCPNWVGGDFYCQNNQLTNLIGGPEVVIDNYYADRNQINDFIGFPDDYEGYCSFDDNPVEDILDQFDYIIKWKIIKYIIEFEAIWNGEVIEGRLEMVKDKLSI